MIKYNGRAMTATQAAKELVFDKGISGAFNFIEIRCLDTKLLTPADVVALNIAVDQQLEAVSNFLNIGETGL